ncbi:MAG: putative metal-dependent phosphoesterase TrpH [Candidatus Woesearchaeota archaeon]|jgi:predicted metal-dependent phosphoesterase TrpH
MQLRIDIHSHTNLDPVDGLQGNKTVKYSVEDACKQAKKYHIDVLAFTHHNKLIITKEMNTIAKKYNILLLPGFEATIEGKHVVLINPTTDNITTFAQLKTEKEHNPKLLVFAPHPYYPGKDALQNKLIKHINLFDCIEYCHFYFSWCNPFNKKAKKVAKQYTKPLIATSDAHSLEGFGLSSTIVTVTEKTTDAIIQAIKDNKVTIQSEPPSLRYMIKTFINVARFVRIFGRKRI